MQFHIISYLVDTMYVKIVRAPNGGRRGPECKTRLYNYFVK